MTVLRYIHATTGQNGSRDWFLSCCGSPEKQKLHQLKIDS